MSSNTTEGAGEGSGDGAFEGSGEGAGVGSSTSCNIGSSTGSSTTGVGTKGTAVGSAAIMGVGVGSTIGTGTGTGVTGVTGAGVIGTGTGAGVTGVTGAGVGTAIGTGVGLIPVIAGRRGGNCSLGRSPVGLVGTGVGLLSLSTRGVGRVGGVGVEGTRGNMSSHSAQSKQRGSARQVVPRTVRERIHASQNPIDCLVVASASSSITPLLLLMGASVGGIFNTGGGEGSTCVQLGACRCVLCAEVHPILLTTIANISRGVEEEKYLILCRRRRRRRAM
mmetsp:Transcript_2507/g.2918  ORF Transcript_2507/g.2918 Transcript_2507/m.2918 type:complete len:278 (-) Transcript_2507:198-1031(-)